MAFFSTITEQAESGLRMIVPYILISLLLVFNIISISYPFAGAIKAPVFLMALYYWSIYRPTLVPPWFVFICGCLIDLLSGLPLGIHAVVFVLTNWIVSDQRRFLMGQSFAVIWFGFLIVSLSSGVVQWGLFSAANLGWSPLNPVWFSAFLGVALFPPISFVLHMTHKVLPPPTKIDRI